MASYTDKLTTFNPYISHLPVIDEMYKAGMEKQQQYNQGVQKIQSQIDNVAGLDIGRDTDKKYLQSKLDDLGNNLKTVAAGDFSNFQLVNSVGGMANQIGKDAYIQAAVYSTASDKKQLSEMEADKKKGTLTPQSKYVYDVQRSKYFNNPNLKGEDGKPIIFTGQYTPSWDIEKHILENVNAVGDSNWTATNVFKIDPVTKLPLRKTEYVKDKATGQMKQVDGGPVFSEYAIKEIRAGKFPENIMAAINAVLNRPEAQQEMAMRGMYEYRGNDNIDSFVNQYQQEKTIGISSLENKKTDLQTKLLIETDPEKKKEYQNNLTTIDANITSLKDSNDPRIAQAKSYGENVDAYKAAIYTQRQKNYWQTAFTTEKFSQDIVENIPYNVGQKKIESDWKHWVDRKQIEQGQDRIDIARYLAGLQGFKWDADPKNPKNIVEEKPFKQSTVAETQMPIFMQKQKETADAFQQGKLKFALDYQALANPSMTKEEKAELIKKYNDDPSSLNSAYEHTKDLLANNPKTVAFANLRTALAPMQALEKQMTIQTHELESLENDPEVIAAGNNTDFKQIQKGLPSYNITYSNANGQAISQNVNPQDIVNASILTRGLNPIATKAENAAYYTAKQQLEAKFGSNTDYLSAMGFKQYGAAGGPHLAYRIDADYLRSKGLSDAAITNVIDIQNKVSSAVYSNVIKAKEKVLKDRGVAEAPVTFELYPKNAESKEIESTNLRVNSVLDDLQRGGINISPFKVALEKAMVDKNNIEFNVNRQASSPDQAISFDVFDKKGLVQSVLISKPAMDHIKNEIVNIPPPISDLSRTVKINKGNSNLSNLDINDPNAYSTAFYKTNEMLAIQNRTDILGADVKINNVGQPNAYLYIRDIDGSSVRAIPVMASSNDILPAAFGSTDKTGTFIPNVDAAGAFIRNLQPAQVDAIINNIK